MAIRGILKLAVGMSVGNLWRVPIGNCHEVRQRERGVEAISTSFTRENKVN